MECLFPGMDPFIELHQWQDFHVSIIVEIKRQIGRQLPGGYSQRIVLASEETRQRTLTIRTVDGGDLVTALEVLSPTNKHGTGLDIYRSKRRGYLEAGVNLVEIDLLRGGIRPHMNPGWSAAPYAVQVVEGATEDIQYWGLEITDVLPVIPVPLLGTDFIALSLQEAFTSVYSYSSYRRSAYNLEDLVPSLSDRERRLLAASLEEA